MRLAFLGLILVAAPYLWAVGEGQRPGVFELSGVWSFKIGEAAPGEASAGWQAVALPAGIAELGGTEKEPLWLRGEFTLGRDWQNRLAPSGLVVLISNSLYGDYEVFAAGELVGSWKGPFPGIAEPAPQVYEIPNQAVDHLGRLQLTLRWSWEGWAPGRLQQQQGMLGEGWILGDRQRLTKIAELQRFQGLNSDLSLMILLVLYLAIGVYHLQLFRRDRRCQEYLWFGLTSIVVASNTLLLTHWIADVGRYYAAIRRLFDVTGLVMVALSIQFLWLFLSRPIGRVLRAYQISFLALACLVLMMPESSWAFSLESFCKIWSIPFLLAVATVLATEVRRGNSEARTVALGGFAIVLAGAVEMTSQLMGAGSTFPVPAVAFTIFALSMAFSLSNRFSRVHDELDGLRLQLEGMVEDRSSELSSANERLQSEISERELAQEAMRMLERAVEQSIDGILVADIEERSFFVNQAWSRMHGREVVEILGCHLSLFHTGEQMDLQILPALAKVREEGSWAGEIDHLRSDGSIFPTLTSITLLRDSAGEAMGFVTVARDITDRKNAEEERARIEARILESEKLTSLADLAGGIAHDYNNLLTGVLGNSSLALKELPVESIAREKLVQIGAAADRAADLTSQLLAYSGAETVTKLRIDLNDVVTGARAELVRRASARIRLNLTLASELPEITADSVQIRQAILHLVDNAIEATTAVGGGSVGIETGAVTADTAYLVGAYPSEDKTAGNYVFLRISDEGAGIDAESRRRIFDPFYSTKASARGLGLATVLSIVRSHRGTIKVRSQPGEGSTFEVLFPVASPLPVEAPGDAQARVPWRGRGAVLVVDDERIMREVSRSILEQSGFEVLVAGEGDKALDLYREHMATIRIVLLDRTMPTMSGAEVLEQILALNPHARVVMMSGYKKDSIIGELAMKGMTDFLAKPFRPEELLHKVRSVLDNPE